MLTYLRIQDLAVIEEIGLELQPGLTVLTGETGAGKSIIIDGLALALGERAALDQIRGDAEQAVVEAAFTCAKDPELMGLIRTAGLEGGDETILVRRVLTRSASRAYLNDRLISLQQLKAVGERLVDLHGQHEHQSLLAIGEHRNFLDRFAKASEAQASVAGAYDAAIVVGERLEALRLDERDRAQRADLLRFQLQEIEAAAVRSGEDEELLAERRRLAHAEELAEAGAQALTLLYEAENSAAAQLHQVGRLLERLLELDPGASADVESLSEARFSIEEAARTLQGYLDGVEVDPQRLAQVEERLAALENLKRKYGDSIDAILEHAAEAAEGLEALEHHEEKLAELGEQLDKAAATYRTAAKKLSKLRRQASGALADQVESELHQLAMPAARFEVDIAERGGDPPEGLPAGASRNGNEGVEFLLAANPGEQAGSLSKVASGGELSRVMLALKLAAGEGDPLETLVFDEVDSGIGGGRVAERLAQRLATLARTHQVLVVTHLPQIAAYADCHLGISKVERGGRAAVEARRLGAGQQEEELARMLGGLKITEATRRHAREMLANRR